MAMKGKRENFLSMLCLVVVSDLLILPARQTRVKHNRWS